MLNNSLINILYAYRFYCNSVRKLFCCVSTCSLILKGQCYFLEKCTRVNISSAIVFLVKINNCNLYERRYLLRYFEMASVIYDLFNINYFNPSFRESR